MTHQDDFEMLQRGREYRPDACMAWALLLPDAADGLLSEPEQRAVDAHVAGCAACAHELADAQRGAAWLGLLKGHTPEPPASLLANILAKTSGAEISAASAMPAAAAVGSLPGYPADQGFSGNGRGQGIWANLRRWIGTDGAFFPSLQPRLAMTSAMAFFSICLTLNLLGFSVRNLHADALRPGGLQRTASDLGASLVRSVEGIRVVYRVEARVNEWRTANTAQDQAPLQGVR